MLEDNKQTAQTLVFIFFVSLKYIKLIKPKATQAATNKDRIKFTNNGPSLEKLTKKSFIYFFLLTYTSAP